MTSPSSPNPFSPPGAVHTYMFVPDHPAFRQALTGGLPAPQTPARAPAAVQPPAVTVTGTAVRGAAAARENPLPVLFPVKASQPAVAATPNLSPALSPPGARPQQLQSFG
ncbi:MAG: hypothetical protein QME79_07970 [Bacillota bacterium]|nr:hypothetical protein [Bacillota bacterium]